VCINPGFAPLAPCSLNSEGVISAKTKQTQDKVSWERGPRKEREKKNAEKGGKIRVEARSIGPIKIDEKGRHPQSKRLTDRRPVSFSGCTLAGVRFGRRLCACRRRCSSVVDGAIRPRDDPDGLDGSSSKLVLWG
jgi:hypothetical protein